MGQLPGQFELRPRRVAIENQALGLEVGSPKAFKLHPNGEFFGGIEYCPF